RSAGITRRTGCASASRRRRSMSVCTSTWRCSGWRHMYEVYNWYISVPGAHDLRRAESAALFAQQFRREARARADARGVRAARESGARGAGAARRGHEREGLDVRVRRGVAARGRLADRALYLAAPESLLRAHPD